MYCSVCRRPGQRPGKAVELTTAGYLADHLVAGPAVLHT
jgi:hypothetical protein